MRGWRGLVRRLRLGAAPRNAAEEAEEEIRFHLEERADELVAAGLDRDEARREAERRFGPVDERRQELRRLTVRRERASVHRFSVAVLVEALRSARRAVVRRPLPALSAVLSLGFGLAALAGVGTLADEIVLRPPAGLADAEELVYLDVAPISPGAVAEALAEDLEAAPEVTSFGRHLPGSLLAVRGDGEAERVLALGVDGGYFSTLGVVPRSGRLLTDEDDALRARVAVISAALARRHLGSERAVGETLHVEGEPFQVVGLAPEAFRGTFHGFPVDLWLPLHVTAELDPTFDPDDPEADALEMIARLPGRSSPDTERRELASRLAVTVESLRGLHPAWTDLAVTVHPLSGLDPETHAAVARFVALLAAVALALLAVAVLPVALWLLARATERRRELTIRSALGGSGWQIAGLLAAEGLWIGGLGAAVGVLLAWPAPAWMSRLLPPLPIELGIEPAFRPRLLLVLFLVALASGVLAAMPGIFQLRRGGLGRRLGTRSSEGSSRSRAGTRLVVAQIAATSALLIVAGSLILGVQASLHADVGVDLEDVAVAQRLDLGSLVPDDDERLRVYRELTKGALEIPGVRATGVISRFPLSFFGSALIDVSAPGVDPRSDPAMGAGSPGRSGAAETRSVDFAVIDAGYLAAAGVEILVGRGPGEMDGQETPLVAMVNEELARRWFGGLGAAVGEPLRVGDEVHSIVGVTTTGRYRSALEEPRPFVYLVASQRPPARVDLVLRTDRSAAALDESLRGLVYAIEPDLPPPALLGGRDVVAARMLPQRLAAGLSTVLGLVGLLLAGLALFAAAAWRVGSRRRELGLRLSLGASPSMLRRSVLAEGLRLAATGLAIGVGLGLLGTRAASSAVPGAEPAGPLLILLVALLVGVLTLVATLGPAQGASRVDPASSLRAE